MEKVGAIKRIVKEIIQDTPVLFLGDRGIGKTSIAFEIAKELNLEPFYLNVSQLSPEHLAFPIVRNDVLDFRTIDLEGKLVILDELTNRNPDLHSALQSLVLDKRIGNRHFKEVYFIATGNRPEHSYLAVELPRPLIERFVLIDFPVPSKEEWSSYTIGAGGNIHFVNFIMQAPDDIYYSQTEDSGLEQSPSPRNNTRTARIIAKVFGKDFMGFSEVRDQLKLLIVGSSGKRVYDAFLHYIESGRYYSYSYFVRKDYPKTDSEAIQLIVDATTKLKMNEIKFSDWVEVFDYLFDKHPKLKHYAIEYYKIVFGNAKELAIYAKNNPNTNLGKMYYSRARQYQ